jgi:transposase
MGETRKKHPPAFKAKVAKEALAGNNTLAELSSKHGVHSTMIAKWKKEATDAIEECFSARGPRGHKSAKADKEEKETLQSIIGRLTVQNDYLKKKLGMPT